MKLLGGCLLCHFLFCLFLFSPILGHQYVLCYFISGEVYSQIRIRFPPSGYIMYQYHFLLLHYHHAFFLNVLNGYDGSFPHRIIYCSSEENIHWWLLTTLCSEDNCRIISTGYLYLNRCNCAVWYLVDLFILCSRIQKIFGWRQHMPGYSLSSQEVWGGLDFFNKYVPDDVPIWHLEGVPCFHQ